MPADGLWNGGGAITVTTAAETAVMTSTPPRPFGPGVDPVSGAIPHTSAVLVWGSINFTPGTGTTGVNIRIRSGAGTSGPTLGPVHSVGALTAGTPVEIPYSYYDSGLGGLSAGFLQYSVTMLQTGAPSAAGTVNYMTLNMLPAPVFPV